jgi:Ankyrin repeat
MHQLRKRAMHASGILAILRRSLCSLCVHSSTVTGTATLLLHCVTASCTPLHLACLGGHVDTAKWLVSAGADTQLLDGDGQPQGVGLMQVNRTVSATVIVCYAQCMQGLALT